MSTADGPQLPLAGVRVLDYAQYVAGPFATMLLADLGADVIKVEPPTGDAWRRYEPLTPDGGTWFFGLNRNKRSVTIDLTTADGRAYSRALIATADVVVHNMPADRALRFGLDREAVRAANPAVVWSCVSAFGSQGPDSGLLGYDLIAQAATGLLMSDARPTDDVPRRAGGIAMADLSAGLLTAIGVLAGLADPSRTVDSARGFEVSLLGAALAVQVQRFVDVTGADDVPTSRPPCGPDELHTFAVEREHADELEPYYRCYRAADGFVALACLNERQRCTVQRVLGVSDPYADNPQRPPVDDAEREFRAGLKDRFAAVLVRRPLAHWLETFRAHGVPCGPVRTLDEAHHDPQAVANGLVQNVDQPGLGQISLLGSVFKVDGVAAPHASPAPALGQHNDEVLGPLLRRSAMERV